ncbi:MAG: hypothetical protein KGL39_33740 [Patescibacteria group bacterium]|nr:hypothetical protein [Patescibacteria group bacterium]
MFNSPKKVLTAQSALNTTGKFDGDIAHLYHTLTVISGAGVSAGVVGILVSPDGQHWFAPAANTVTTSAASTVYSVTVGPIAARFAQADISTGITGGTVDAWIAAAGE